MSKYAGMHATHFGLYPDRIAAELGETAMRLAGHTDPRVDEEIPLPWMDRRFITDMHLFVSGSWKCWGPADQDGEGDDSLHLVVYTKEMPSPDLIRGMHDHMLGDPTDVGWLLEWGTVTSAEDWSVTDGTWIYDRGADRVHLIDQSGTVLGGSVVYEDGLMPLQSRYCDGCQQPNLDSEACPNLKTTCVDCCGEGDH